MINIETNQPEENQLKAWREIVDLSDDIAHYVEGPNWGDLLAMVEVRDIKLDSFFKQDINPQFLPEILKGVDTIKAQHKTIMLKLSQRDDQKREQQEAILEAKESLQPNVENNLQPGVDKSLQPAVDKSLQLDVDKSLQPALDNNLQPNLGPLH